MIKMKRSELSNNPEFQVVVGKLLDHPVCYKTYKRLTNILTALEAARKETRDGFMAIVKQFSNLDEKGEPVRKDEKWDIQEGKTDEFNKACEEFFESEAELKHPALATADFETAALSTREWHVVSVLFVDAAKLEAVK